MQKFSQFDHKLNIERLPLTYSLGDLTTIREIFTPEDGDVGRTQLPILPPTSGLIVHNEREVEGYLVETSTALMSGCKEFLHGVDALVDSKQTHGDRNHHNVTEQFVDIRRDWMNRVGARLVEVIRQERRLGVYNLFWLTLSKYIGGLLERVIAQKGGKQAQRKLEMLPVIAQTLLDTIQQVKTYLQKEDGQQRQTCKYIDDLLIAHVGAAFNYEFSRSVITDQIHLVFPELSRTNLMECAELVFAPGNAKYHITHEDFVTIYTSIRQYVDKRLKANEPMFIQIVANIMKVPSRSVLSIPLEAILFHPGVISIFTDEIRQLPVKTPIRKKSLFKAWTPVLGELFEENSWEFAIGDYLNFAKDVRRSEIIALLRQRIAMFTPHGDGTAGVSDKISYRFDKGRILNDLRNVTLIFLDLRGFTELSASDVTDQELKQYLYNFFDPVVNIINHFDGCIKTYAGDGILASFGENNDHALQAVRAAIEIRTLFNQMKSEKKIPFSGMGIGIHTGMVEETYFFADLEAPSINTVIGLSANMTGRLSSGKAEKHGPVDLNAVKELKDFIQAHDSSLTIGSGALAIFEDRLHQAVQTLQQRKHHSAAAQEHASPLSVNVNTSGILNNHGIALSNEAFTHLQAIQPLQERQASNSVRYAYQDQVLHEELLLIKAGDAVFKGLKGKFPVWGVYLQREFASS